MSHLLKIIAAAVFCATSLILTACDGSGDVDDDNAPAPTVNGKVSGLVGVEWGKAVLIESSQSGSVEYPQVAFDANGNALAVWVQADDTGQNIWANFYTAATNAWGTAVLIETNNAGNAEDVQIAVNAKGDALAIWRQTDASVYSIWANHYTVGTGWGTPALIEIDNAGDADQPQIAIDANGNALAVWFQSDGTSDNIDNIWANHYTVGAGWGTAKIIETENMDNAYSPQVAFDAKGNALAVWQQAGDRSNNIWANRYTAGVGWGAAAPIEGNDSESVHAPQIAFNAKGDALAVWVQWDGERNNVWANRYTTRHGWGKASLIETDNTGKAESPQVAIDANGNALAVWFQSDGTRDNIWANRYTAGAGWGTATVIETDNTDNAYSPQVAFDAKGNALAVWEQSDGTRDNIWANRYTASTGWGKAALIETNNAGDAADPQIAVDANGNAIAVWRLYDEHDQHDNVWANRFQP